MENLTLDRFLAVLSKADLQGIRHNGQLGVYDRQEALAERQDIEKMRWKLDRSQPGTWIPWIVENRNQFLSERFRTITRQGLLNLTLNVFDPVQLAA